MQITREMTKEEWSIEEYIYFQIDFDKWTHEEDLSDEARDIMEDYPDLYNRVQAEEMGWPTKSKSRVDVEHYIFQQKISLVWQKGKYLNIYLKYPNN